MVAATSLLSLVTLFIGDDITNNFTGYEPTPTTQAIYYFYPRDKLGEKPQLVDFDSKIANSTFFPKCCPPHFLYEPEDRQCVEDRNASEVYRELNVTANLIKRGLFGCQVVVDRFVDKSRLQRKDGDGELVIGDETFPKVTFCVDGIAGDDSRYVLRLCYEYEYCLNNTAGNVTKDWCVYKCCPDTFALQDEGCQQIERSGLRVKENRKNYQSVDGYGILYSESMGCDVANRVELSQSAFSIRTDGRLLMQGDPREYKLGEYCLDTRYNTQDKQYVDMMLLCEFSQILYAKWALIRFAVTLSCVCFVLTIGVYVFVYKLQKLVEKVIVCFCLMDLIFWILYDLRIFYIPFGTFCTPLAYILQFVVYSRLTWLNVLSYEIWSTIGRVRVKVGETRQDLRKKFLYYCLYAFGLPLLFMILFILSDQEVLPLPSNIRPYINPAGCGFDTSKIDSYSQYIYLYVPTSVLIIFNLVFYTRTVIYFLRVKRELNKISDSGQSGTQKEVKSNNKKGYIILKLGLVMGITWIYYIYDYLNSFNDLAFFTGISDILVFFNVVEGLYFLIIFAVKWKTVKEIWYKFGICRKKEVVSPAVSTTSTVCTSVGSTESLSGMAMEMIKT